MRPEEELTAQCPCCGSKITIGLDTTGGESQAFTYDCEVCCRPISVRVELGEEGVVSFSAEPEGG